MKNLARWLLLTGLTFVVGFALAWVVLVGVNAVLPPFRPEDDETWREIGPVALAYATWALTTVAGSLLALRRVRRSN